MGTAYGISNCIGFYRAGVSAYKDAGVTLAVAGDSVQQWNDLSGAGNHLTQATSAARPVFNSYATAGANSTPIGPYGNGINYYAADQPQGIYFDGSSTYLNIPTSLTLTSAGATVIMCTRGAYWFPVGFGTDSVLFNGYGYVGGNPAQMGIFSGSVFAWSKATFLPFHTPIVHGFRASAVSGKTHFYMGTNQSDVQNSNLINFTVNGGTVGRCFGTASVYGNGWFNGEVLELAVFNSPLTDPQVASILSQMQDANAIRSDANGSLVVFVGDSQTAGGPSGEPFYHSYPYWLARANANAFKPLVIAYGGATCANQQTYVTNQVALLDFTPFSRSVAICCCGINDIIHSAQTDLQTQANFISLAQSIKAIPGMKLIAVVPNHLDSGTTMTSQQLIYFHNYQAWLRANWSQYADALVDWPADPRLANNSVDSTCWADEFHTTEIGDRIKAQLIKPTLDAFLTSPQSQLAFGTFYSPGRAYAGTFGTFVRS